jgi:hypothetical protein
VNRPIDLAVVGMPGCQAHMINWFGDTFLSPGPIVQVSPAIPNDPTLISQVLVSQTATYSPPLTPFGYIVSNAIVLTFGL